MHLKLQRKANVCLISFGSIFSIRLDNISLAGNKTSYGSYVSCKLKTCKMKNHLDFFKEKKNPVVRKNLINKMIVMSNKKEKIFEERKKKNSLMKYL